MRATWCLQMLAAAVVLGWLSLLGGCSESLDPLEDPTATSSSAAALSAEPVRLGEPLIVPFVAGPGPEMGTLTVSNDATHLYVTFTVRSGWVMIQSRLGLATSLESFPRPWRCRPGDLAFHTQHPRLTTYTYAVPLEEVWAGDQELYLAASMTVFKVGPRGRLLMGRFAWAEGQRFPLSGWLAYFTYRLQSTAPDPCALALTFPDGPAMLCTGQFVEISWESEGGGCGDEVRIELLHDGEPCLVLATGAPNTGLFVWDEAAQCGAATNGYTVRVTDLASGSADESDEAFWIIECPED